MGILRTKSLARQTYRRTITERQHDQLRIRSDCGPMQLPSISMALVLAAGDGVRCCFQLPWLLAVSEPLGCNVSNNAFLRIPTTEAQETVLELWSSQVFEAVRYLSPTHVLAFRSEICGSPLRFALTIAKMPEAFASTIGQSTWSRSQKAKASDVPLRVLPLDDSVT